MLTSHSGCTSGNHEQAQLNQTRTGFPKLTLRPDTRLDFRKVDHEVKCKCQGRQNLALTAITKCEHNEVNLKVCCDIFPIKTTMYSKIIENANDKLLFKKFEDCIGYCNSQLHEMKQGEESER